MTAPAFLTIWFIVAAIVVVRGAVIMRRAYGGAMGKFTLLFVVVLVAAWAALRASGILHV